MKKNFKIFIVLSCLLMSSLSCTKYFRVMSFYYDSKDITVQYLSLFNQHTPPKSPDIQWLGNWAFRRERLQVIDQYFRKTRPDLLILQEVMAKNMNIYDSDLKILSSGSLLDYTWQSLKIQNYQSTEESEYVSVVTGFPLHGLGSQGLRNKLWVIDDHNFLSAFIVSLEQHRIGVFNAKLNFQSPETTEKNLKFIYEKIKNFITEHKICDKRVILAGEFKINGYQDEYINFLDKLNLKDPAEDSCEDEETCYTTSSSNTLYQMIQNKDSNMRDIRILVHNDTTIFASNRNFNDLFISNSYFFGPEKNLNPTLKYGWSTTLRLANCLSDQLQL